MRRRKGNLKDADKAMIDTVFACLACADEERRAIFFGAAKKRHRCGAPCTPSEEVRISKGRDG